MKSGQVFASAVAIAFALMAARRFPRFAVLIIAVNVLNLLLIAL